MMIVISVATHRRLGLDIRKARTAKGYNLKTLACLLNLTDEALRQIEIGETQKISIERLQQIDRLLDTDFAQSTIQELLSSLHQWRDEGG